MFAPEILPVERLVAGSRKNESLSRDCMRLLLQICVPLPPWAVRAGARRKIYFEPSKVNAAVVTCGGKPLPTIC